MIETSCGSWAHKRMITILEQYNLVEVSGLFDKEFYLLINSDVSEAGLDPLHHYLASGWAERRDPSADFDSAFYLDQCEHLGICVQNPLLHYLLEGRSLGLIYKRSDTPATKNGGMKREDAFGTLAASEHLSSDYELMIQRLLESNLFDAAYYAAAYSLQFDSKRAALDHFISIGSQEGKRPNLYFDPIWYLDKNPDIRVNGVQPLFHYLLSGDAENRQPSLIFDPAWYRAAYKVCATQNALEHFLAHRTSYNFSPLPDFDVKYYGDLNRDVKEAGVDPFDHFLFGGFLEGRNPSSNFNIRYYAKRYLNGDLTSNPFLHFLEHKGEPGIHGSLPEEEVTSPRSVKVFTSPGPDYEDFKPLPKSCPRNAKILAYYLPQFHSFPENDEWWGKGFTEWTNVARGTSRFSGHYQPRIPRDLGFYNLENALPTMRRQVEMAIGGGVYGFVFYYYWFNGKRLMEKPVEQFLTDASSIEMPFCLMWANENWTRRWDGAESDVLISQSYDPDDDERLAADFVRHFKDRRYIRVDNRPLLMIYRPGIIPEAKVAVARWRNIFREQFNENPLIVMAQGFGDLDPTAYGIDGAIEFPPHKLTANVASINNKLEYLDIEFSGSVVDYSVAVDRSLNEPIPSFPLIKTAVPSWDNDARRQGTGWALHGSTPAKYQAWMAKLIQIAGERPFFGERFVCVNAWNEWAEAAYLEPDLYYGSAYLNATARAVSGLVSQSG